MKRTDKEFETFCTYYNKEDFDSAAKVLYDSVVKTIHDKILLNPLVKTDLSYALEQLAHKQMDTPTPELYHQTIDQMVKYLEDTADMDLRTVLN